MDVPSGESDECGDIFTVFEIEFEDEMLESDNFVNASLCNEDTEFFTDSQRAENRCGKLITKMIMHMTIKIEDEMEYFDLPPSSDKNITAFVDKPYHSETFVKVQNLYSRYSRPR